jgi:hypothetical protein
MFLELHSSKEKFFYEQKPIFSPSMRISKNNMDEEVSATILKLYSIYGLYMLLSKASIWMGGEWLFNEWQKMEGSLCGNAKHSLPAPSTFQSCLGVETVQPP